MVKVAGITLPLNCPLDRALTAIYGIGLVSSRKILSELNLTLKLTENLSEVEVRALNNYLRNSMTVEAILRNKVKDNVMRKVKLGIYKGNRHVKRLPVRGQRTSTNASTNKLVGRRF